MVANVLALLMIMRRLGVHGWALSVLATAVIWFVKLVNQKFWPTVRSQFLGRAGRGRPYSWW